MDEKININNQVGLSEVAKTGFDNQLSKKLFKWSFKIIKYIILAITVLF